MNKRGTAYEGIKAFCAEQGFGINDLDKTCNMGPAPASEDIIVFLRDNGFVWPEVGGTVEAPDCDEAPNCGAGDYCTATAGSDCTVKADNECTVTAGDYCTVTAGPGTAP